MKLSKKVNDILKSSKMNGDTSVSPYHLLYSTILLDENIQNAFKASNHTTDEILNTLSEYVTYDKSKDNDKLNDDTKYIISLTMEISDLLKSSVVEYGVFLYILVNESPLIKGMFDDYKLSIHGDDKLLDILDKSKIKKENIDNDTNTLKHLTKYSINLTEEARSGKLQNAIGVDDNVNRIIDILSRKKKNNPILIGEPGVGKSTIIDELAIRIVDGNCPKNLIDKEIYTLNISSLVAGTKYRCEVEERLEKILKELENNKEIIVFIDEVHTIVGTGNDEKTLDVSNIIKPALANGKLSLIGATTLVEFRQIEKDKALSRRFAKVNIEEPSTKDMINIISETKHIYQTHHNIEICDSSIKYIVNMCDKYISDNKFPDKAFDVIDELGVLNKTDDITLFITNDHIDTVISKIANIDISKLSDGIESLNDIDTYLKSHIFGQDNVIEKVTYNIKKHKLGLGSTDRPIASYLFMGDTGTGKTQLAKELSSYMYKNKSQLIKFDMSEYQDKHDITKLIGSAPGYVGYENGGVLLNKVKHNPNCVIVFDEVEKAHKDIFNILLQILDDGELHNTDGDVINFRNTIIILTSNYKNNDTVISLGGDNVNKRHDGLFNKELINRLDDVITFNNLNKDDLYNVAATHMKSLFDKFMINDIKLNYSNDVLLSIAKKESDARSLIKYIERKIENYIVSLLILNNTNRDLIININIDENNNIVYELE